MEQEFYKTKKERGEISSRDKSKILLWFTLLDFLR